MALLDDILGNSEIGDDAKFTIGNHELTLGDLRGLSGQLAERDSRLSTLESERNGLRSKYDELAGTMTRLLGQANQAVQDQQVEKSPTDTLREALSTVRQGNDPAEPLFQDKVFGAFANRLQNQINEQYNPKLKELSDSFSALKDLVNNGFSALTAATIQQDEKRWYGEHRNELPKDKNGMPVSLDSLKQYAQQNGFYQVNQQGQLTNMIDLNRALNVLTEPTRLQTAVKEAEERAYQRGLNDSRRKQAEVIPMFGDRPAGTPTGETPEWQKTAGKTPRQIMRAAIGQALSDLSQEAGNQ